MKYTKEERLEIGRQIYDDKLTRYAAAERYDIGEETARSYMRLYRDANHLPPKHKSEIIRMKDVSDHSAAGSEDYASMTKEELVNALIKEKIAKARLKKGYIVKGDGVNKEFVPLDSKNTK